MNPTFDPRTYADALQAVGVPPSQADVHARTLATVVGNCAVTREDLHARLSDDIVASERRTREEMKLLCEAREARLEGRLGVAMAEVKHWLSAFEARVDAKLDALEARVDAKLDAFDLKISALEARLMAKIDLETRLLRTELRHLRWFGGIIIALNVAVLMKVAFP